MLKRFHGAPALWAMISSIVSGLLVNYLMGKDLNADLLNYHLYTAHAFWTGAYKADFMGSGLQGFLNPIGYVPAYLMIKAGWHSLTAASVLAAVHALNIWLVWLIGWRILFRSSQDRVSSSALAATLAAASPVFIAVIGSSFLDPIVSLFTLTSLYLVCSALLNSPTGSWKLALAGTLLGAATGLKLTGIAASTVAVAALLITAVIYRKRLVSIIWFISGLVVGAISTGGAWAYHLWSSFQNPVYPLANDIFRSPDFASVALTSDRFIPQSMWEVIEFPFRMAKANSGTYVEIMAPDIRFALIAIGLVIVAGSLAWRRILLIRQARSHAAVEPATAFLVCFFLIGTAAWMTLLGNGRYQLHLLLLAGPMIVLLCNQIFGPGRKGQLVSLLILVAQVAHANVGGYPRWDSGGWTDQWLKVRIPDSLESSPRRFLVIGPGVDSAIAAYLPAGSHFFEIAARSPIDPESPEGKRIATILRNSNELPMVLLRVPHQRASQDLAGAPIRPEELRIINQLLDPWGLNVAAPKCSFISVTLDEETAGTRNGKSIHLGARQYALMACPLRSGTQIDTSLNNSRLKLLEIKRSLEANCPLLFRPPGTFPIRLGEVWNIRYFATDIYVTLLNEELAYSRYPYGPFNVPITLTEDMRLDAGFSCKKPPLPW